ncbi:MAG TPA: AbrB/MazE/SpoVT family DNA-binding domain-containing protein [Vicinamibacteria bacterium]|nr:AbrB/MazE/SpoVT family DNA-binding domain-containing protein [Vicinamibacteria bacterium]
MKTRLVRIGNSRGIRLPKPLIEQAGLSEEVELEVREGEIVITRPGSPREGWAEAAQALADRREDTLTDESIPTHFDLDEWHW